MKRVLGHFSYTDSSFFVRNLIYRLWAWWYLKALGTMGFIALFFSAYFYLMQHHFFTITQIPIVFLDTLIPFDDRFLILYLSLWGYVSLPAALLRSRQELLVYGGYCFALCAIGVMVYLFFPTSILQDPSQWAGSAEIIRLKSTDMNANAFPSMHVASAVFACFWLNKQLSQMNAPVVVYIAVVIWCIGIVYSTMAIRQHLFVDVAGGFILGVLMAIITLKHYSKRLCSTIPKK